MHPPRAPAVVIAAGLLFLAASACAGGPAPSSSSSQPSGAATALSMTTDVSPGAPGIEVTGVIPVAGSTTWDGTGVTVAYHRTNLDKQRPDKGDVNARRCRLAIDGRPAPETAEFTPLSPSAFAVVFRTDGSALSAGAHTLRVVMPLVGGGHVTCTWAATSE